MSTFDSSAYSDILRNARLASEALGCASTWHNHLAQLDTRPARTPMDQWKHDAATRNAMLGHVDLSSDILRHAHTQLSQFDASPARAIIDQLQHDEAARNAMLGHADLLTRFDGLGDLVRTHDSLFVKQLITPSAIAFGQEQAGVAQNLALPSALESFRTPFDLLSSKLMMLDLLGIRNMEPHLEAFTRASAFSDLISQSLRVDRDFMAASNAFALSSMPTLDTLAGYRSFLDAAGLGLPRWPKFRLLSWAEKRRRFKARLQGKAETPHIRKAKSLVHRYELTLREVLDAAMAATYGEDWAEARLPLCGCKDLLGRWKKRGGDVLDHADYAHYARIMSNPEHFAAIFEAGFDDPHALAALLDDAGRLRAASHHAHEFTPSDLRDLRITWRTIETGLLAFTADYEVEAWG
ncbi:hypothetical protein NL532_11560 [Mesorhizobium sp. C120A]|uniref:hypothetical protein n=1 Tax=unclassified Mesorhizobium TaxID=325217 RepID=UPI0004289B4E|nr:MULTISPECIES: hypothetical protein [unclassified Mesorhizobium]WJI47210.1 hypothetical protein NL532_11560 [Mesorhizobium sp. C120A]